MTRSIHASCLAILTVIGLVACSSGHDHAQAGAGALPDDCETFVASYQRYLSAASPGAASLAAARAHQTRVSLEQEAKRGDTAALAMKCRDNLKTIPRNDPAAALSR